MAWVKAASLDDLREKPIVFKQSPLQIAVFRVDGRVFAVDNRCPHEGYPLAAGNVTADCVVTCNWHNWKFRLTDGACILGGDDVRSYATRMENDEVWIDTTPPPANETREKVLYGLRAAFDERDYGRICREIARLHFHSLDVRDAVRQAIGWSYDHLEFGETHASAGAADWLALAETFDSDFEKRLICLAQAVDHLAFDSLRRPRFPYAVTEEPFERNAFLAAVEAERTANAEGMAAHAVAEGRHWADLEEAFAAAAPEHYNDFGHTLIYVQKTGELIGLLGDSVERFLLLAFTRTLCYATREDLIPDFKDYAAVSRDLPEPRTTSAAASAPEVPFPSNLKHTFKWLKENLAVHSVTEVYDALLTALARNMLFFDTQYGTAYDRPVSSNVSWLDFTHGLTFSNAVHVICNRYPHLWRPALLQMACFLGRNFHYLDKNVDAEKWRVGDVAAFLAETHERLLDHGFNDPNFAVHLLKTTCAVEAELPLASPECREALLAGLNRFLHSPIKMKHTRRLARQAIALVSRDFEPSQ